MSPSYDAFVQLLVATYRRALAQALPPRPRVAQHWVDPHRLTWLGLLAEQARFQFSYSLGRLKAVDTPGLHTSGVFHLVGSAFPQVDEQALAQQALAQVPTALDGPTRAFLVRVLGLVALREVAGQLRAPGVLPMPTATDLVITLPLRADALDTPQPTPVVHPHALTRVQASLALLEPALAERVREACVWPGPALNV